MPPKHVPRHVVEQPLDQSIRLIPLTQGKTAIVDAEDYEALSAHHWIASGREGKSFYAVRYEWKNNKRIASYKMHSVIQLVPERWVVDHINGNTLDNRRSNLRAVTYSQNSINRRLQSNNTSGHKGVSRNAITGKWTVLIQVEEEYKLLGSYASFDLACKIYDAVAAVLHGEYRRTAPRK